MAGEFLSLANLNHLIGITNRFLYDKYNFRMMETVPNEELRKEWQTVMLEVYQSFSEQGMGKEFQKMNMKTLSTMKDRIKERFQLQLTEEKAFTHALAQQSTVVSVPVQGNPIEPEERILDSALEENEFMDKVRVLENQRRSSQMAPVASSVAPPTLKLEPAKPVESNYIPPTTTVVVPSPTVVGTVAGTKPVAGTKERTHFITIHAKDRSWQFSPLRHSWIWSGSLPANTNMGSLKLSALVVPHWVNGITPFVMVEITGAGGQKMRTPCMFRSTSTKGWTTLFPLESSSEIRPLATPWTIALLDAYDKPLALGEDSMIIKECDKMGGNQYRVNIHEGRDTQRLIIGDIVEIGTLGEATLMREPYVGNKDCSLFLNSMIDLTKSVGEPILVKTAQPSLIFEISVVLE